LDKDWHYIVNIIENFKRFWFRILINF
jgi:hypothetical protein